MVWKNTYRSVKQRWQQRDRIWSSDDQPKPDATSKAKGMWQKRMHVAPRTSLGDVEAFFPFDKMITVLVGPHHERFEIHKGLACKHQFFKAALQGNFTESNGTIWLPEHDPDIFRWFTYWLYTGTLTGHYYPPTAKPTIAQIQAALKNEVELRFGQRTGLSHIDNLPLTRTSNIYELARYQDLPFDRLIGLYLLADYLRVPELCNEIVDHLIDVYGLCGGRYESRPPPFWRWVGRARPDWLPNPVSTINAVWEATSGESKLSRLLVTLYCENTLATAGELQEEEALNPEFLTAALGQAQDRWVWHRLSTNWLDPSTRKAYHVPDRKSEVETSLWETRGWHL
ncbi:MAG: hypothetical protein Q9216_001105 [Gyalolechia sp. 2 TL-2023]